MAAVCVHQATAAGKQQAHGVAQAGLQSAPRYRPASGSPVARSLVQNKIKDDPQAAVGCQTRAQPGRAARAAWPLRGGAARSYALPADAGGERVRAPTRPPLP